MKGVILAGGKGTRLFPLTAVTNKHLISVGNLPMIEYPLCTLRRLNPESISVVTGGEHFQDIARYLGEMHPEINFSYHYQKEAGGIAQALSFVGSFVKPKKIAVVLGDNIFENDFQKAAIEFEKSGLGAMLFLKQVNDPERFGVAEIKKGRIVFIEEKPKRPKSNLAVTGLYFYDSSVFDKIKRLKPSKRGELEISHVNQMYIDEGRMDFCIVKGYWSDAGTIVSRMACEKFVKRGLERQVVNSFPKETISLLKKLNPDLFV
ncbi:MAG: NTP transferase domain-containing protein [Nanoarchaeota archaeon]|nr:NTP transferase domain-containing protein [Nanoarchaeota archaeon]